MKSIGPKLNLSYYFFLLGMLLFLAACRASDCGCPQ
jgi:hypothetical protein